MTKRFSQSDAALLDSALPEGPLKKRAKTEPSTLENKHQYVAPSRPVPSLINLVSTSLAEVSDDDPSSAESDMPKLSKVAMPSLRPTALPSLVKPLRSKAGTGVVKTANYCRSGKPLACPPMLLKKELQKKLVLKEIDSTLQ